MRKQYENYNYRANNTFRYNNKPDNNKTRQRSYEPSYVEIVKRGLTERKNKHATSKAR